MPEDTPLNEEIKVYKNEKLLWDIYEARWKSKQGQKHTGFDQVPWPPNYERLLVHLMMLLNPEPSLVVVKKALKDGMLRYHPDKCQV